MISAFPIRKPTSSNLTEEPQLVSTSAGTQAQTGRLQGALTHLLCIKRLSDLSDAECCPPPWLCGCYPPECQVLHELDLSYYIMTGFLVREATGQGSTDEFSGTAAICLNKALFNNPRMLARRRSSQPVPPGARFSAVPACLRTGSWKAWQRAHSGVFLSGIDLSPGELKRKIAHESFAL